jgi:hypothetical protein
MKRFAAYLAGIAAITALAASAWAYPTLNGPTGTGNLPTAEIATPQTTTLALDLVNTSSDVADSWRLLYGANDRFEASANYVKTQRNTWGVNAKYLVSPGTAVGGLFGTTSEFTMSILPFATAGRDIVLPPLTFTLPRTNTYQLYAVHTFDLMKPEAGRLGLAASIGANWTSMTATGINESAIRGFACLEAKYGKATIAADYQTKDDEMESNAMWSAVGRYDISSRLAAQAGFGNMMGVLGNSTNRFFGGLSYQFVTD